MPGRTLEWSFPPAMRIETFTMLPVAKAQRGESRDRAGHPPFFRRGSKGDIRLFPDEWTAFQFPLSPPRSRRHRLRPASAAQAHSATGQGHARQQEAGHFGDRGGADRCAIVAEYPHRQALIIKAK
jgi:hypothetical protein